MRKLIRIAITVTLVLVFSFSSNSTIVVIRKNVTIGAEKVYAYGIDKMKTSTNENVAKVGNLIQ